jgi:hypothetical protein
MNETAAQKLLLLERIARQREELGRDIRELRDGMGWSRALAGSVLSLVGQRPKSWKTWVRILAWLPAASRVARLFWRRRRKKRG